MKASFETPAAEQEIGEGARILHALEQTGIYVFHGSPHANIPELNPHQPTDWPDDIEQEDGAPCVAASQFADAAIFHAIARNDWWSFGQDQEDGSVWMAATQKALDMAKGQKAYVYVFLKSTFAPRNGNEGDMEWRSVENQKPLQVVEVTDRDLPKNISILPPKD